MLNLNEREEKILRHWSEKKINDKVRAKNKGHKKFYFLDGPPYVTGDLHPGHIWVKTLKDVFVRYKRYRGFDVVDRAGYDVHGLPIENRVERELGLKSKEEIDQKIGIDKFVKECRNYVEKYMGKIDADYARYGVSLDFRDPYLAYTKGYMETAWGLFKKVSEKGFLYKGRKTLLYCPHCETSLSQGSLEVEYSDTDDPSLFMIFKIDAKRSSAKLKLADDTYLAVWTTTPWTIPANVAIAVNPKEMYVIVLMDGKKMVVAKSRVDYFSEATNKSVTVLEEFYGSELDGIYYINPIEAKVEKQRELRKYHKIILSESTVSMSEGTGLVHTAPGNGVEDYVLGVQNKLPIFSPVAQDATYTSEAGAYRGIKIPFDANRIVLEDLEELGVVLGRGSVRHSYPHCWRCNNKLIFIATDQWFLNMQKLKSRLIKENEKISWHPEEVRGWEKAILENSPDWCISRQRYWGIPMPIWVCKSCGKYVVIGSVEELSHKAVDAKEVEKLTDFHRPHIDTVKLRCECNGEMDRVSDILDVWWDSGIAFRAALSKEQFGDFWATELVVEYVEQIRAWFQCMLKCSMMIYGKNPFKHIVVHGIMFGPDGKKLSKSLGNYKPLSEMLKLASADAFRFWSASFSPILNKTMNELTLDGIRDCDKIVTILYNASNLLEEYRTMLGYKPEHGARLSLAGLELEDLWILSRLESVTAACTKYLDNYEIYNAAALIKDFIVEDFSRFYLKLAKRRMLYSTKAKMKKIVALIDYVLHKTLILASPIMPFVSEGVYLDRYGSKESIFLEEWPRANARAVNSELEKEMEVAKEAITAILNSREKAGVTLRWPIANATLEITDDASFSAIQKLSNIIESYVNAKHLVLRRISGAKREVKPAFAKLGPDFKDKAKAVADALKVVDAEELSKAIATSGHYSLHTQGGTVDIRAEHFTVVEKAEQGDAVLFRYGIAHIDKNIPDELKEEAFVREFERGVQLVRRELGLKKTDKIELGYEALGAMSQIVKKNAKKIAKNLNALKLAQELDAKATTKDLDIEGESVRVSVKRLT